MGRPKLAKRKPSRCVTLNNETIELLNALGEGNVSAGIEIAFQGYAAFRSMSGLPALKPLKHEPTTGPKKKPKK